ncbi:MAG TPA: threonine synthase, partial [Spirochaetia bacterium]|nr:threonine synthase [Spirochaetia bacterium]
MRFASRRHPTEIVSFEQAMFTGLAADGGLYHPVDAPDLAPALPRLRETESFPELAAECSTVLLSPDVPAERARSIAGRAFTFSPVLRRLDENVLLLELFHGPTCAFKDFGAQFLAAAMEALLQKDGRRIQILVATSGDTGSAVASAFHGRSNIDVVILYPSGRVSHLQEQQLTTLGGNVSALEVRGSFDDCQRLVKEAFQDPTLRRKLQLTSANSINVGRLLPQCLYYIYAGTRQEELGAADPEICVPSGNFGNLTAGVYAWRWGLPVHGFIAATNVNDVVPVYLRSGTFNPRPSAQTLSNAMDVGNPSNFERLTELFKGEWEGMASMIEGRSVTDERTLETMRQVHAEHGVLVDPHTAVGCAAARDHVEAVTRVGGNPGQVIVLCTAHPSKFADIV